MVRHRATQGACTFDPPDRGDIEENDAEEDCYAISEETLEVFVQGNIGADCQGENAEAISRGEYCPCQSLS
jgi:hypothetical protein